MMLTSLNPTVGLIIYSLLLILFLYFIHALLEDNKKLDKELKRYKIHAKAWLAIGNNPYRSHKK